MLKRLLPLLALATPLAAQVRASEAASVAQTIDGTVITVEYSRPSLRGRTPFGGIVHWGEKWTPGANWATTLDANRDVHLNGHPLPKGKYSVWIIPQQTSEWTVIFHKEARRFHTQRPREDGEQLRFSVATEQAPPMEMLTWNFPSVQGDGAALRMQWGTTVVPLRVRVNPTKPRVLASAERARYVGRYRLHWIGPRDTVTRLVEVSESNDGIAGKMTPAVFRDYDLDFGLFPAGENRFRLIVRRGDAVDAEEIYFQFLIAGGRATGFEIANGLNGETMGRAERIP